MRFLLWVTLMVLGDVVQAVSAGMVSDPQTELTLVTNSNGEETLAFSSPVSTNRLHFDLTPTEVVTPELAAHYPGINTWRGVCRENEEWTVRCDRSAHGIYAQVFTPEGTVYLDRPAVSTAGKQRGELHQASFRCLTESRGLPLLKAAAASAEPAPVQHPGIRTFRLAVAAAGEYTQFNGGTVESAMAAIVTVINRVNGIYERDLGVRLVLVEGTRNVIFTDPNADPFTSNDPSTTTTDQAQQTLDLLVGSANYDVGMVFNTGTYGLAYFGSVCDPGRKGSACMGLPAPVGERFAIYVAHEMAHQFGANHSFNSNQGYCAPNRNEAAAVEPGTGSTLLSYAGLDCANDSLQPLMDDYFHAWSIHEVNQFLQSVSCGQITPNNNQLPTVSVPANFVVPKATPFQLTASGSDPDGDTLTWTWEQMDIGPAKSLNDPDNGSSALFRSLYPGPSSTRVFPRWESLLANAPSHGEQLPSTERLLHFRVTARDARNNGALASADTHVQVVNSAGPFRLTSHNNGGTFSGAQTITWDVAGTTGSPINAATVNILLSTNGGTTFSVPLATNTRNDGVQEVSFPNLNSSSARLKLEAVGHIFFDINNASFSIGALLPRFTSTVWVNGNLRLRWTISPGKSYALQALTNFGDAWQDLSVSMTIQGNEMEASVPGTGAYRFFRVREF